MTNNLFDESLVTFRDLAKALPKRSRRSVHHATVSRWRANGLAGGIKLEAIRIGGIWHTSWEAFRRFCDRLTAANADDFYAPPSSESATKADGDLQQRGW